MQLPKELPEPLKILIVDDHPAVRQGIIAILREAFPNSLIREAGNGKAALALVESFRPAIMIIDVSMPEMGGVDVCIRTKKGFPELTLVVYSMFSDAKDVKKLIEAGISAYILKSDPLTDLVYALNLVRNGGVYFSKGITTCLTDFWTQRPRDPIALLSDRECEVLKLIAEGFTTKEIADKLCIATKTVETHKYNMFDKLNVKTVAGLVRVAVKSGLCNF